jgi:Outer membrane protein beta-barrel domain
MLALRGNQITLTLLLILSTAFGVQAQSARGNYNFMEFDRKPYYFGITSGFGRANFQVFRSKDFILNDSVRVIEGLSGPIFNLGIVSNLKIGDYFDIRLLPTISFSERNINFTAVRDYRPPYDSKFEQVFVELPLQFRYKSMPYHDKRLFILGGIKYGFDVAADSRSRRSTRLIKVAATDFALEYGIGMMFYFPFFIFSPEIKMSNGLNNSIIYNNATENLLIDRVLSRTLTISFHFEG